MEHFVPPISRLLIPDFTQSKNDLRVAGQTLDFYLLQKYWNQVILLRAISSNDHAIGKDDLIQVILEQGVDRYDSGYDSFWEKWVIYQDKGIDIFASLKKVDHQFSFGMESLEQFFNGALFDRGYRVIIDIILIYNPDEFLAIPIQFPEGIEHAWKFKDPNNKLQALKEILVLNRE